jgi:hypothetical protein
MQNAELMIVETDGKSAYNYSSFLMGLIKQLHILRFNRYF